MSQPVGPAWPADALQQNRFPVASSTLSIGAADTLMTSVFASGCCRRVTAQGTGTIYIKRQGDAGFTAYAVTPGYVLEGIFVAIGGTGTGSSAITCNLEL